MADWRPLAKAEAINANDVWKQDTSHDVTRRPEACASCVSGCEEEQAPHDVAEPFSSVLKPVLELSILFCHISWLQTDSSYTGQKT